MSASSVPPSTKLSKSKYLTGLQCHKRLYLQIHSPELGSQTDAWTQSILDMGTRVGELARRCFAGGVLVDADPLHLREGIERTRHLMEDPAVPALYEAAFEVENIRIRADVMSRLPSGAWHLIEVKSSTAVKAEHLDDVAVQSFVLQGAGVPVGAVSLLHLNSEYLYPGGELDVGQLFSREDVTAEAQARQGDLATRLTEMRAMLAAPDPPTVEPDYHCWDPYECPFWAECTRSKPPRWIFHLPGGERTFRDLAQRGIVTIDEIPDGFPLGLVQQRMRANREWIGPGLQAALATATSPVHHLDFETVMPAIPFYPNTRPYQTIPFQWSNHVEASDGSLRHDSFLVTDQSDPRRALAQALLDSLGQHGSICVYSGYEARMIRELADALPDLRANLERLLPRLWDLLPIIKAHYYHPDFQGSFSIKAVLPALVPTLAYSDLEIQDGGSASSQFYRMVFAEVNPAEREQIQRALLRYCARDTIAMVELRRILGRIGAGG